MILNTVILSVIMMRVIMLSVVKLGVVMLNAIMLNVVLLKVVAPVGCSFSKFLYAIKIWEEHEKFEDIHNDSFYL
jgi:hypothetical protein